MPMTDRVYIAILEDNAAVSDALVLILGDQGFACVAGRTAEEIESGLRGRALSHIISDFNIAGFPDGVTASQSLRVNAPEARVLIMTGGPRRPAEEKAHAAGFDFMRKPARADDIISWVRHI